MIITVKFSTTEIMSNIAEILVYRTAVKFKRIMKNNVLIPDLIR